MNKMIEIVLVFVFAGAVISAVKAEILSGNTGSVGWACQMSRCFAYSTASGEIIAIRGAGQIEVGVRPQGEK